VTALRVQAQRYNPRCVVPLPMNASLAPRAATKTVEKPKVDTKPQTQRPWNVIVHDDPVTLMNYVTRVFMDVFRYSQTKAHKLMMEVHTAGKSVVWTGAREQAETYVTRLQSFHLLTTLEPSGD
jgi:ATP-dependent Clp protease adaptor protein ClpS